MSSQMLAALHAFLLSRIGLAGDEMGRDGRKIQVPPAVGVVRYPDWEHDRDAVHLVPDRLFDR
ncbi:hypothetical protein ANO11243_048960 [Dothideomycetidae sp. 11243]|nr:hypothetical protein ANO11243_048960 [fungal sp. No.11243]